MTGIIIGRFQTPYLHAGHLHLIAQALVECEQVVILLGCTMQNDDRNPYDIGYRRNMIGRIFPQVQVNTIWDVNDDDVWSEMIDKEATAYSRPVLYYSRDSFVKQYTGRLIKKYVKEIEGLSATKIRNNEL